MNFRRLNHVQSLNTLFRFYSKTRKNHYDVLNLRRNCSDKDIKDAFIQMSKEYHPDKNKDAKAQEIFVRIVEAYNVLGKPGSRARYDSMTEVHAHGGVGTPFVHKTQNYYSNPQYTYYQEPKPRPSKLHEDDSYYGVNGLRKVPNFYLIAICFGIALIGGVLQMYVIRNLYVAQRKQAQEKSKYLAEELEKVRTSAHKNGNEMQTRLLLDKIVSAANPTVATASLGQALASEKE